MSQTTPHQPAPARLASILGQDRAIDTLRAAVASARVHHAWIFSGPKGVGKFTAATAFAAALLDPHTRATDTHLIEPPEDSTRSEARTLLDRGNHPDLHIIRKELARFSEERNIRDQKLIAFPKSIVDRFLLRPIARAASRHDRALISKAFIIDEAELLDRSIRHAPTQASLLKTLEEPPPGSLIILVTSNEGRLLPTVRSRCQRVTFNLLNDDDMQAWIDRSDIRQRVRHITGEQLRDAVRTVRKPLEQQHALDTIARKKGQRGTMSATQRQHHEQLTDLLDRYRGSSFADAAHELPEWCAKAINKEQKDDGALIERVRTGPSDDELAWLRRFAAGSPGRFLDAAVSHLHRWHTTLDPLIRRDPGGYELGMAMRELVEQRAQADVKRNAADNRSKEAANIDAARNLIILLGDRGDEAIRKLLAKGPTADELRQSSAIERTLARIEALHAAERRLAANVNMEQGIIALAAALRA